MWPTRSDNANILVESSGEMNVRLNVSLHNNDLCKIVVVPIVCYFLCLHDFHDPSMYRTVMDISKT